MDMPPKMNTWGKNQIETIGTTLHPPYNTSTGLPLYDIDIIDINDINVNPITYKISKRHIDKKYYPDKKFRCTDIQVLFKDNMDKLPSEWKQCDQSNKNTTSLTNAINTTFASFNFKLRKPPNNQYFNEWLNALNPCESPLEKSHSVSPSKPCKSPLEKSNSVPPLYTSKPRIYNPTTGEPASTTLLFNTKTGKPYKSPLKKSNSVSPLYTSEPNLSPTQLTSISNSHMYKYKYTCSNPGCYCSNENSKCTNPKPNNNFCRICGNKVLSSSTNGGSKKKKPSKTKSKKISKTKPKKLSKKKSPKIHTGPRGGKYIVKKGKKIYQ